MLISLGLFWGGMQSSPGVPQRPLPLKFKPVTSAGTPLSLPPDAKAGLR